MITNDGNNGILGIIKDFDYCQKIVKDLLNDLEYKNEVLSRFNIYFSSANSINWGRLFPQIFYSINSYLELLKVIFIFFIFENNEIKLGDKVDICIPSGNFGNLLGAFIAKQIGLPLDKLICASNEVK